MGIGSLLLGIALLVIVALIVSRPLVQGYAGRRESLSEVEALQLQKEALLEQIRSLDFEHETGKMPDDEHRRQRAALLQEAAAVLKALDDLDRAGNGALTGASREVEAAIAAVRRLPGASQSDRPTAVDAGAQIEAAVRRMRAPSAQPQATNGPPPSAERFCASCGEPRDAADKFCAYCGTRFD